jgi:DNA-3-methyladenine glycosylase II
MAGFLLVYPVGYRAGLLRAGRRFGKTEERQLMSVSAETIRNSVDAVAAIEPAIARALEQAGYPGPRIRERGYRTMLRTIVGQQVSVAAAASMWRKLETEVGEDMLAAEILSRDFDALRACGLSRQKQGYIRSLCELVAGGELDFENLPADDEDAIAELVRIKGVGRWSAEIYLLFAEGRRDIWPAGDLAVQAGLGRILGLPERPSEKHLRELAEPWRPHRGPMAIFTWHYYNNPAL